MYRPEGIREHYNRYGEKEWDRLEKTVHGIVEFEVTLHILEKHLPKNGYVLDAGGGPGRYAIRLAQMGYEVFLLDISEEQLRLAERRIDEAGVRENVTAVKRMDVCDMSEIPDATFDAVLCLGGALSYVSEQRSKAIEELIRVAKPGSPLAVSVMSLLGTFHLISTYDASDFLVGIRDHVEWDPETPFPEVLSSKPGSPQWHAPMTLYTSVYLRRFLEDHGCRVVEMASTNTITSGERKLEKIASNPEAVKMLVKLEKQFCNRPGVVDMGQHLLAVAITP
jgi:SAM-dependent methyltransferase